MARRLYVADAMNLILHELDFEEENNSTQPDDQTQDLDPGSGENHERCTSTTSRLAQD